ncbi:MAG: hypothetical protein KF823_00950 [Xanthomonadales bacterium]|nr:hypothetical protein [Xanthomonadales bacterium]
MADRIEEFERMAAEAAVKLAEIQNVLAHTLQVDDRIEFSSLLLDDKFPAFRPASAPTSPPTRPPAEPPPSHPHFQAAENALRPVLECLSVSSHVPSPFAPEVKILSGRQQL